MLTTLSKSPPSVNCLRAADVHQPRPSAAWSSSSRACWPGAWELGLGSLPGAGEPAGSNCLAGKHANTPLGSPGLSSNYLPDTLSSACGRRGNRMRERGRPLEQRNLQTYTHTHAHTRGISFYCVITWSDGLSQLANKRWTAPPTLVRSNEPVSPSLLTRRAGHPPTRLSL